jgi:hypothetical protein
VVAEMSVIRSFYEADAYCDTLPVS